VLDYLIGDAVLVQISGKDVDLGGHGSVMLFARTAD
jgi:hypothetical protein